MLNGIREILSKLDNDGIWSIKLLKLHSSAREGFSCAAREIKFESEEALRHHVEDIKVKYLGNKPLIEKYQDVREYDGTTAGTLYGGARKTLRILSRFRV